MATISNTPRPGYVWDSTDNVWYPIGVGGHGHTDYITQATAVNPTLIDAKGDIITATAADTPARLAVGNNGETLVADSATSTGLRYQGNYAAGKNKIINGDFGIWQRGTSFSATGSSTYTADRWTVNAFGGTTTVSRQTFTPGTAPVAGYEGSYFLRFAASATFADLIQKVEDVRTFAGQAVTVSFWAKAASSLTLTPTVSQEFGSGGSVAVDTAGTGASVTTSWTRFSANITVPSISGKTIGTGSSLWLYFLSSTLNTNIDIWGVQLEAGSVATAFQTATGTIQGELAACQRYYIRYQGGDNYIPIASGSAGTTSNVYAMCFLPVEMRVKPSSLDYLSIEATDNNASFTGGTLTMTGSSISQKIVLLRYEKSAAFVQYRPYILQGSNSASAYVGFNAEL